MSKCWFRIEHPRKGRNGPSGEKDPMHRSRAKKSSEVEAMVTRPCRVGFQIYLWLRSVAILLCLSHLAHLASLSLDTFFRLIKWVHPHAEQWANMTKPLDVNVSFHAFESKKRTMAVRHFTLTDADNLHNIISCTIVHACCEKMVFVRNLRETISVTRFLIDLLLSYVYSFDEAVETWYLCSSELNVVWGKKHLRLVTFFV